MDGEIYDDISGTSNWKSTSALVKPDGTWITVSIPGKTSGNTYASDINENGLMLVQWYSEDWSQVESYYCTADETASIIEVGGNNCCASRLNNYGDWIGWIIDSSGIWQAAKVIDGYNLADTTPLTDWHIQRHSEAFRGIQRHSEAFRGIQRHSEAFRGINTQRDRPLIEGSSCYLFPAPVVLPHEQKGTLAGRLEEHSEGQTFRGTDLWSRFFLLSVPRPSSPSS
jgi:hypothetical protein